MEGLLWPLFMRPTCANLSITSQTIAMKYQTNGRHENPKLMENKNP